MSQTNDPDPARTEPAYYDARAAMLLGICSLVLIPWSSSLGPIVPLVGLAALIVSIKAVSVVVRQKSPHSMKMAMTGLITSIACWVILVGWISFYINDSRNPRFRAACLSNSKQIGMAMSLYADDYDDRLPPIQNWQLILRDYLKLSQHFESAGMYFQCPSAKDTRFSYGINSTMNSISRQNIQSLTSTVFAFDCSLPKANAAAGREAVEFRHTQLGSPAVANFVFADGHAKAVTSTKTNNPNLMLIDQVQWKT